MLSKPLLFKFNEWNYQNEYRIFDLPKSTKSIDKLSLKINRIFIGYRAEKSPAKALQKICELYQIELFYLKTPFEHEKRLMIIHKSAKVDSKKVTCPRIM